MKKTRKTPRVFLTVDSDAIAWGKKYAKEAGYGSLSRLVSVLLKHEQRKSGGEQPPTAESPPGQATHKSGAGPRHRVSA